MLDEKDGTVKVECRNSYADYGDVVRQSTHPQDTSEFILDDEGTAGMRDDGEEGSSTESISTGDEIGIGDFSYSRTVSNES